MIIAYLIMIFWYLKVKVLDSLLVAAHLSVVINLIGIRESKFNLVTFSLLEG